MRRLLALCLLPLLFATPASAQCPDNNRLRNPYFGDLHVHSSYSFDAILFGVEAGPREAYDFARGTSIALPPYDLGDTAQLRRPLDFSAVTDHAEFFGEGQICTVPGAAGYDSQLCQDFRAIATENQDSSTILSGNGLLVFLQFAVPLLQQNPVRNTDICGPGAVDCPPASATVWTDIQAAAEEKNDSCNFSTFHGWEWTANSNPAGGQTGLHRNVIFRNGTVPATAISYIEEPTVEGLWDGLVTGCLDGLPGCDVLTIPHNSNFSAGRMFVPFNSDDATPLSAEDAAFRASIEPVVEIFQHKGSSECRPGSLSNDELCSFESLDRVTPLGNPIPGLSVPPLSFVRNGLKEGLVQDEALGVNPFPLGIIGSTDGHNGMAGATFETDYGVDGHQGANDWSPERILNVQNGSGIESNGGGLAVIWAEENTRDALFDAVRRREVYGTSGTRPILRTFAGRLPKNLCNDPDFVEEGYKNGVPMGGEIGAVRGGGSPSFAVMAIQDAGSVGAPGTPLQRLQIVKGWVDAGGNAQEQVFDVAGDPDNGATVDINSCAPQGTGFSSLCAVWKDPNFEPEQRAFYYARVIENPTCRWHRALCNSLSVDCNDPGDFSYCCDGSFPDTIQERAWSSPIFYRPEAAGRVRGKIEAGSGGAGDDRLKLTVKAHEFPAGVDPRTEELTIELFDDDVFYSVTLPPGAMKARGGRGTLWSYRNAAGDLAGIRTVALRMNHRGLRMRIDARGDLYTGAGSLDGPEIGFRITLGDIVLEQRRIWTDKGGGKYTTR